MIRFLVEREIESNPNPRERMLMAKDFSSISPLECVFFRLFEDDKVTGRPIYWDCLAVCIEYTDPLAVLWSSIGLVPPQRIRRLFTGSFQEIISDLIAPAILIAMEKGTSTDAPMFTSTSTSSGTSITEQDEKTRKTMSILVDLYLEQLLANQTPTDFRPLHHAVKTGLLDFTNLRWWSPTKRSIYCLFCWLGIGVILIPSMS